MYSKSSESPHYTSMILLKVLTQPVEPTLQEPVSLSPTTKLQEAVHVVETKVYDSVYE